jgi:hypothetical protein
VAAAKVTAASQRDRDARHESIVEHGSAPLFRNQQLVGGAGPGPRRNSAVHVRGRRASWSGVRVLLGRSSGASTVRHRHRRRRRVRVVGRPRPGCPSVRVVSSLCRRPADAACRRRGRGWCRIRAARDVRVCARGDAEH